MKRLRILEWLNIEKIAIPISFKDISLYASLFNFK